MNTTTNTPDAAPSQSPGKALSYEAIEIALILSKIGAIVFGVDEAVNVLKPSDNHERIVQGHIVDYISMIREQVELARAAAERIEVAGYSLDRANA